MEALIWEKPEEIDKKTCRKSPYGAEAQIYYPGRIKWFK